MIDIPHFIKTELLFSFFVVFRCCWIALKLYVSLHIIQEHNSAQTPILICFAVLIVLDYGRKSHEFFFFFEILQLRLNLNKFNRSWVCDTDCNADEQTRKTQGTYTHTWTANFVWVEHIHSSQSGRSEWRCVQMYKKHKCI